MNRTAVDSIKLIHLLLGFILAIGFVSAANIFNITAGDMQGVESQQYFGDVNGTTGILDGAIGFDGQNNIINISGGLSGISTRCFSIWFNQDSLKDNSDGNAVLFDGINVLDTNERYGQCYINRLGISNPGFLGCQYRGGGVNEGLLTTQAVTVNEWNHLVYCINSTKQEIWINGILNVSGTETTEPPSTTPDFEIGSVTNGEANFNGTLDEFVIYSKFLSSDEINSLYQSGTPTQKAKDIITDNILYYSSMDELSDLSGNNYHGQEFGDIFLTNKSVYNVSNTFNFTNQSIRIKDFPTFTHLDNFSYGMWIKPSNTGDVQQKIIRKGVNSISGQQSNSSIDLQLDIRTNRFTVLLGTDSTNRLFQTTDYNQYINGSWVHVFVTYNTSGSSYEKIKIYIDGTEATYLTGSQTGAGEFGNYVDDIYIGNWNVPQNKAYDGLMSDVLIYDQLLTDEEILALYQSYTPVTNNPPYVDTVQPTNGSIDLPTATNISFTVYDDDLDNLTINFTINDVNACNYASVTNGTNVQCNPTLLNGTFYTWNATISDSTTTITTSTYNFTTNGVPDIILYSPNTYLYNTANILINFTSTDTNVDTYWFFNGTANETYTTPKNITLFDGIYNLYFYVNDTLNFMNQTNYTFQIDTTLPTINIDYPTATTYFSIITELNYTTDSIEWCWYNTGGSNSTPVNDRSNFTGLSSTEGSNTWTVYCNNSFDTVTSDSVTFTTDLTAPGLYVTSPVAGFYNTTNISILINSTDALSTVSAIWYNNGTDNISYPVQPSNYTEVQAVEDVRQVIDEYYIFNYTIPSGANNYSYLELKHGEFGAYNLSMHNISCWYSDVLQFRFYSVEFAVSPDHGELYCYNGTGWDQVGRSQPASASVSPTINNDYPAMYDLDFSTGAFYSNGNGWTSDLTTDPDAVKFAFYEKQMVWNISKVPPQSVVIDEGNHLFTFYTNDSVNNMNTTTVNFTIDLTTPSLIVNSPTATNYTNSSLLINITATDTNLDTIWFDNGTANLTYTTPVYIVYPDNNYTFTFYANDTVNHINSTSVSFTLDTTGPVVTIHSPENITYGSSTQLINFTAVDNLVPIDQYWYEFNGSNETYTVPIFRAFDEGTNRVNMYSNDILGNIGNATIYFTVNSVNPTVSIDYPTSTNYSTNVFDINYITNADGFCWYSNGTINSSSVAAKTNFTNQVALEGNNNWTVYCNNTVGNIGNDSVTFNVDTIAPSLTIYSPTNTTYATDAILINFTATDIRLDSLFFWNGTQNVSYTVPYLANFSNGDLSYIFYANDTLGNINSTVLNFTVDSVNPSITIYSPNEDNSTVGTNASDIIFNMTFFDTNLFGYNLTCINETGYPEYSNETLNISTTTYNFYDNFTFIKPGNKTCTIIVADDHTANKFDPDVKIKRPVMGFGEDRIVINDELEITYDAKNPYKLDYISYEKKRDRISPIIKLKNPKNHEKDTILYITVKFLGDSWDRDQQTLIAGHIVILPDNDLRKGYWFDVLSDYENAIIEKVKVKEQKMEVQYKITIPQGTLKNNEFKTKSIGGLNIVNKTFTFEILGGKSVNVSGYDALTGSTVPTNVSIKNGGSWTNYTVATTQLFALSCGITYSINITAGNYFNNYFDTFDGCEFDNITAPFYKAIASITAQNAISLNPVTNVTLNVTQVESPYYSTLTQTTTNPTIVPVYPANQSINLTKDGYSTINSSFEIFYGQTLNLVYNLTPVYTTNFYREQTGAEFNFVESTDTYQCANGTEIVTNYSIQYTPNIYTCSEGWDATNDCDSSMDGLSSTFGQSNTTSISSVNFTFNKPTESINKSQLIIRKDVIQSDIINMTEFPTCWDQGSLKFQATSNTSGLTLNITCYNGSEYIPVRNYNNGGILYRAYMNWAYESNQTIYSTCDNVTNMYVDVEIYCPNTVLKYRVDNLNRNVTGVDCQYDYWLIKAVYSVATYYRTLIPSYDETQTNVYLLDLNLDEAIEIILKVNDIANQYNNGQIKIYKYVNGTRVIVIQQFLDIEKRAVLWLDKYETYEICSIDDNDVERCHGDLIADTAGEKIITLPKIDFVTSNSFAGEDVWWYFSGNKTTGTATLHYKDLTDDGYNQLEWIVKDKYGAIVSTETRLDGKTTEITITGLSQYKDYYTYLTIDHKNIDYLSENRGLWFASATTFPGFDERSGTIFKLIVAILVPLLVLLLFSQSSVEIGTLLALIMAYIFNSKGWFDLLTMQGRIDKSWIDLVIVLAAMYTFWIFMKKARKNE